MNARATAFVVGLVAGLFVAGTVAAGELLDTLAKNALDADPSDDRPGSRPPGTGKAQPISRRIGV